MQKGDAAVFGFFVYKIRDQLLDGEIFYSLCKAHILTEELGEHYKTKRPHSAY